MNANDPIREAGLAIDHTDYDLVPVIDDEGVLIGIITTRSLARRYVRESRASSSLREATYLQAVVDVLDGELLTGEDRALTRPHLGPRLVARLETGIEQSDIVVVGDRVEGAAARCIEHDIALLVLSNGAQPDPGVLELARQKGTAVITSPLDTYVSARMITLAGAVPRADGERPDRRHRRRADQRGLRADQGLPPRRRDRRRRAPAPDRAA